MDASTPPTMRSPSRFTAKISFPRLASLALTLVLVLPGCATVGPTYTMPSPDVPARWFAPVPHEGSLRKLGDWWQQFDDPVLAQLQQAAEHDSPTLAAAWGNIEIARATLATARSGGAPTVSATTSATRSTQQGMPTATTRTMTVDASWELDLFGKVRRGKESAQARLEARRNDWHDARVTLAAEVATEYINYRACALLAGAYEQELVSIRQTTRATESLVRAGLSPSTDAALARATEASTTSTLLEQRAQCELLVKTLVNLTGLHEPETRLLLVAAGESLPTAATLAVDRVPAEILRQRPDVASRERELAAASAGIGVAQADLYPSVKLGGSIGLSGSGDWSFGPSLSLPVFNGGARRAAVDSAHGSYEVAHAQWRGAVRGAVSEVEKALVQLNKAGERVRQAEVAAQEYRRYLQGAEAERQAGTISLLDFEQARRQALMAQIDVIALQRDRLTHWIALYKALGGGWDAAESVTAPASRAL